ncbi:MAG: SHOCT domain-containing protein [Nitrospinae bacterium]|nr:SHOCT domain-containing protein [Nitrospinota bacterium]
MRFSHPLDLKPEQWVAILSSIRVQSESGFPPFFTAKSAAAPAFDSGEIAYLGAALSESFAQAQPEKWATFYLSRSRSPEVTEVVTGAWFVGGTRLHLLLANYRLEVTMPNILDRLRKDPLFVNVPPVYALVPGKHQTLEEKRGQLGRILKSEVQDLSIDYNSALTDQPDAPRFATPDAPASPTVSPVEERLRTLQRLKDDGLITEKEYQEKRKEILKDL